MIQFSDFDLEGASVQWRIHTRGDGAIGPPLHSWQFFYSLPHFLQKVTVCKWHTGFRLQSPGVL